MAATTDSAPALPDHERGLDDEAPGLGLLGVLLPLWHRRWRLLGLALLGLVLGYALSLTQPPMFSGRASFVVPVVQRPSQAVVAELPPLAGLIAPGAATAELHLSLLRSQTVTDRILERFDLQKLWKLRWRIQARQRLAQRVDIVAGRRDNVVRVEVRDEHPQRAAAIANQYIDELRDVLRGFALEEARERRRFYGAQLAQAQQELAEAQRELQASGYDRAALRAEPRAAAESYLRLQADVTAAEVRLAALRRSRADTSAEVQAQRVELSTLRAQLARLERPRDEGDGDFVGRLREFRQAERLVESIARQAEAARVDEAAESQPVQIVDQAQAPEWPSSPRRGLWVLAGLLLLVLPYGGSLVLRHRLRLAADDPLHRWRLARIRSAL